MTNPCIFCAADCDLASPPHSRWCPQVTNVWPQEYEDMQCIGCHGHLGGFYSVVNGFVVCVPCAERLVSA